MPEMLMVCKIHIIINNAGLTAKGSIEESSTENLKKLLETNVLGSVNMAKLAIPYLRQTKGSIIFIGSLAGLSGMPYFSFYSASKMALTAIAQALKIELRKDKIHVGIAYVGFTENDVEKQTFTADGKMEKINKRSQLLVVPVSKTAKTILKQIYNRKNMVIHTFIGKLNYLFIKICPGIVELIVSNQAKNY